MLKQDKVYNGPPGQLNLSQQYENNGWSKMIFEQKLVISKIWAKKSTKNCKKGSFPNFGGQKFKNDYSYLITSTSCTSRANFKSF